MEPTYTVVDPAGRPGTPQSLAQIRALVASGALGPNQLVWRSDDTEWRRAAYYQELGVTAPNLPPAGAAIPGEAAEYRKGPGFGFHVAAGANWYWWILGLSAINFFAAAFRANFSFLIGCEYARQFGMMVAGDWPGGRETGWALGLLFLGFWGVTGVFASRGQSWAFLLGILVLGLDTLLAVKHQQWISVAVHAYVIYRLGLGLHGAWKMRS